MKKTIYLLTALGLVLSACKNPNKGNEFVRVNPSVKVEDVQPGDQSLTVRVTALPGILVRAAAHEDGDFTDQGVQVQGTATGNPEDLVITGLTNGVDYYVRSQGENKEGDLGLWAYPEGNPYRPQAP